MIVGVGDGGRTTSSGSGSGSGGGSGGGSDSGSGSGSGSGGACGVRHVWLAASRLDMCCRISNLLLHLLAASRLDIAIYIVHSN